VSNDCAPVVCSRPCTTRGRSSPGGLVLPVEDFKAAASRSFCPTKALTRRHSDNLSTTVSRLINRPRDAAGCRERAWSNASTITSVCDFGSASNYPASRSPRRGSCSHLHAVVVYVSRLTSAPGASRAALQQDKEVQCSIQSGS